MKALRNRKQNFFIILSIIWMVIIFFFSAQDGDESSSFSDKVGMWVGYIVNSGFDDWTVYEQKAFVEKIAHSVRKTAHAFEYAVLAILIFEAEGAGVSKRKRYCLAWAGAVMYATTDEIHQLFVPGRSAQFTDVCIDGLGSMVGIIVCFAINRLIRRTGEPEIN